MNIDELTLGQLKEIQKACGAAKVIGKVRKKTPLPFGVGDQIIIRTVTAIDLGRGVSIGDDFIVLTDGGWVASTGRFNECLKSGTLDEFERSDQPWFVVGRGAIVDIHPWPHKIPDKSK